MAQIVALIDEVLQDADNENVISSVRERVNKMMKEFPMFAW
jgi:glycine hydroxymethyltransferase